MVNISEHARQLGRIFAEHLDQNRDGRITSREQLQPLIDAVQNTPPEFRRELAQNMQRELSERFSPETLAELSPAERSQVNAGLDLIQSIADPERLRDFCGNPDRVAAASQALNAARGAIGAATNGIGNFMSSEEIDSANSQIQSSLHHSQEFQALRQQIPLNERFQMDAITSNIRIDTIRDAVEGLQRGLSEGAPQGFDPLNAADVCHGLNESGRTALEPSQRR
jgi:hypothetical protein